MGEGKTFIFHKGSQYVEHIDSQINNFHYYGGKPQKAADAGSEEDGQPSDTVLSPVDRMINAIRSMVEDGEIKDKQEFAAVYRVAVEKLLPEMKRGEFCRIVNDNVEMNDAIRPSDDNVRKVVFSEKAMYPNWRITGFSVEKVYRYTIIAKRWIELIG